MEENKEFTTNDQALILIRIESLLEEMIVQQILTRFGSLDYAKQLFSIALTTVQDGVQAKIKSLHSVKVNDTEG